MKKEMIEGIYEGSMNYKRFEGMTLQEFYTNNMNSIEKHLLNKEWKGVPFQQALNTIYSDIIEND